MPKAEGRTIHSALAFDIRHSAFGIRLAEVAELADAPA
jgi:hypothetical protein